MQEAFVRAASSRSRFDRVDNPEAWLRTTAINLHRNRWRKLRNFSKVRAQLVQPVDLPGLEEHLAVVDALRTLPEAQRVVLALHYLADLQLSDIAATLEIAEGTVKSRLSRGREALAHALSEEDHDV